MDDRNERTVHTMSLAKYTKYCIDTHMRRGHRALLYASDKFVYRMQIFEDWNNFSVANGRVYSLKLTWYVYRLAVVVGHFSGSLRFSHKSNYVLLLCGWFLVQFHIISLCTSKQLPQMIFSTFAAHFKNRIGDISFVNFFFKFNNCWTLLLLFLIKI